MSESKTGQFRWRVLLSRGRKGADTIHIQEDKNDNKWEKAAAKPHHTDNWEQHVLKTLLCDTHMRYKWTYIYLLHVSI